MADQKLSQKDEITTPQDDFWVHVVDPDNLTVDPDGKSFKMTRANFLGTQFSQEFLDLIDVTIGTYVDQGGKKVSVNSAETGLEFTFYDFLTLIDVDETTYTGNGGKVVSVKDTGGLEFLYQTFLNLTDVGETTLVNNQGKTVVVFADTSTEPATYSLKFESRPTFQDIYGANGIVDGGLTYRGSGLDYNIWANKYIINGIFYDNRPVSGNVTNSLGDASNPRIDVYYVEINGAIPSVGILEGTPAASPVKPTLDLTKQAEVSFRVIAVLETVDPDAVIEEIFNDNTGEPTEWTNILLPAGADLADIVSPKVGVSSALFPAYLTPSIVSWQNDVQWTYVADEELLFYIKPTTSFVPQASLEIQLQNSVSGDYWLFTLTPQNLTNYGYDPSVSDWQLIQVKLSNFVASSRTETEYNTLQITLDRTPELGVDWLVLQGGVQNPSDSNGKDQVLGWGFYVHDQTVPSTQTITTTTVKLIIDGAGATSNSAYLPREIRGISELWDTVNNKILPINEGDGYTLRVDLNITAKTGSPTELEFELDIGGGATPTIVIVDSIISTGKTPPYTVSVGFPLFSLSTFITNGGQIFLKTNTGTITLTQRQISIHRISSGLT